MFHLYAEYQIEQVSIEMAVFLLPNFTEQYFYILLYVFVCILSVKLMTYLSLNACVNKQVSSSNSS